MSAAARYNMGTTAAAPVTPYGSGADNGAVTSGTPTASDMFDTDRAAFWLLGIGAVTLGLIAASASVKFGPVRVAGKV